MIRRKLITIVAATAMVAMIQTAQAALAPLGYTDNLADLVNNNYSLQIDDKTFSGFYYQPSTLTSFNPSLITVTASYDPVSGVDYLTWTGDMSLSSGAPAHGDLVLKYIVTASQGSINMIDQAYTGSDQGGFLAVDETAAIGGFSGQVVGSSHLTGLIPSNPPSYANDNLNVVPPQTLLYVTKDISFSLTDANGGLITISQVGQSFHQVPEPTTMIAGALLLLPFGASTLRILRRRTA